jgi:large subunit ribosomal protein L14
MIQLRTRLKVADNSGAKILQCFHVFGGSKRKWGQLGDMIGGVIKEAEPRRAVKKHEKVRALIIRQKKMYKRKDGTYIGFDDNACVILEGKTKEPKGGRILGPVAREIREKGFDSIANLAEELI